MYKGVFILKINGQNYLKLLSTKMWITYVSKQYIWKKKGRLTFQKIRTAIKFRKKKNVFQIKIFVVAGKFENYIKIKSSKSIIGILM